MKRVRVTWVDSYVIASWTSFEDINKVQPPTIVSEGLLLVERETDDKVVRLIGMYEDESGNAIQIIPRGCILKIEEV